MVVGILGLGYVGLPLAREFATAGIKVIGFDVDESKIKKDIEDVLPPGTSGVVAVFDEIWVTQVEKELAKADKKAVSAADKETTKELKDALAETKKQES
ncbi:MAG: NAD(P)-binding domain-containing protein [Acidimicrobiia bacterium]|nr:NAD(P)-binding domain-containing protein [Acidimicrobiia bacterium]